MENDPILAKNSIPLFKFLSVILLPFSWFGGSCAAVAPPLNAFSAPPLLRSAPPTCSTLLFNRILLCI
ncbi:hypothetical protein L2E82_32408 [Cichorium intybus]|uniref:Uncharacterized protein n=1 Tax=Cichorium intybus TaxID=13427 RepID=A0ACB9BIE9_CICIN|nr:hypothetical protein L2E82_32408 [Cichorium intybus]